MSCAMLIKYVYFMIGKISETKINPKDIGLNNILRSHLHTANRLTFVTFSACADAI